MKKITLAIFAIAMMFSGTDVFAQGKYGADSAECLLNLSYYKEYFKQKGYDEALPSWRKAYKLCPATANQNMIIDGTVLMRRLISQNAKNPTYRAALVDTLMALHDARINNYPKYAVTAKNNKGLDMLNYCKDDEYALYSALKDIIDENKEATNTTILVNEMNLAIKLYGTGKVLADDVLEIYARMSEYLSEASRKASEIKNEKEAERIDKVKADFDGLFATSKLADCDNLIKVLTPRFDADPENLTLASSVVKMMSRAENCQNNELYLKAATSMYKLDPSYYSAYFLYKLNAAQGNFDRALHFIDEAIDYTESDNTTDANYAYEAATLCFKNGKMGKAEDYATRIAALTDDKELNAKAYMLIGQIWGATNCGGDEIHRRASYWVASDFVNKAKNLDPSLSEEANKLIGTYSRYYPTQADAFMYGYTDGQSYTVTCGGMRATTIVRTQK